MKSFKYMYIANISPPPLYSRGKKRRSEEQIHFETAGNDALYKILHFQGKEKKSECRISPAASHP